MIIMSGGVEMKGLLLHKTHILRQGWLFDIFEGEMNEINAHTYYHEFNWLHLCKEGQMYAGDQRSDTK